MSRSRFSAHLGLRIFALVMALTTTGAAYAIAHADEQLRQSGTVSISQTRVAFLVSGNAGGGTLHYHGRDYPFTVGGLGIGGIGVTKLEATGTVYNMNDRALFPGVYSQLRRGITVGDQGNGVLSLKNSSGVVLKLRGASKGLGLSLGADAVTIQFK
jgi:hypothetical protein